MPDIHIPDTTHLETEAATQALGVRLAPHLGPGDAVLLSGPVGAGKSVLARAIVNACRGGGGEVPSPSFTLVQTYEARGGWIWHADLYRLSGPGEVRELGLGEALGAALLLVEWPDRLGPLRPPRYVEIALAEAPGGGRHASLSAVGEGWDAVRAAFAAPPRALARRAFLAAAGETGPATPLAGDASPRRYFRTSGGVLMDAPGDADGIRRFLSVTDLLAGLGLSPPAIQAADPDAGLVLLEDLGDDLFARHLARRPDAEPGLYAAAVDVLLRLASADPTGLPAYSAAHFREETGRFPLWYVPAARGAPLPPAVARELEARVLDAIDALPSAPPIPVLVDFHAENLVWLPDRTGVARVGLLDHQDARAGPHGYDLVSLLEDARRDVSEPVRSAALRAYAEGTGQTEVAVETAVAVLGAQRNLKILGLFARLARRDGRPGYVRLMPRVWGHLARDLTHPALAPVADWIARHAARPDPTLAARLGATAAADTG